MGALFLFILNTPAQALAKEGLQQQIDTLPSGGTLKLDGRVYHEKIVLSKPITIVGINKTIISQCSDDPVIRVTGGNITVKNLRIESCGEGDKAAAIEVSGEYHKLENLIINTVQYGIKLDEAYHSTIKGVEIIGNRNKNGIDLWNSSENLITNSTIQNVYDGIYLENSNGNKLLNNRVTKARYGYHIMFSDQTELKGNHSSENSTGAMIMTTYDTRIENNELINNKENVHSQGLLLYDTYNAKVLNNHISHNRVGIFADNSQQNVIENNQLSQNFIGMQMREFHNNDLVHNSLIGNVYDSQAMKSEDNQMKENFWDSSLKLDINGNGMSVIPYISDPYFLSLTSKIPEYQLFFHSPGMLVLQKLLKSEEGILLKDASPRMEPMEALKTNKLANRFLLFIGLFMVLISSSFFLMGRRKL